MLNQLTSHAPTNDCLNYRPVPAAGYSISRRLADRPGGAADGRWSLPGRINDWHGMLSESRQASVQRDCQCKRRRASWPQNATGSQPRELVAALPILENVEQCLCCCWL